MMNFEKLNNLLNDSNKIITYVNKNHNINSKFKSGWFNHEYIKNNPFQSNI